MDGSGSFVSPSTASSDPSHGTPPDIAEVGLSTRIQEELKHYRYPANESPSVETLLARFETLCGDYFVSAIRHGIRINILATYASESRREQETVKAAIRAKGFGVTASASTDEDRLAVYDVEKFHFVLDQEGIKNTLVPAVRTYSEVESLVKSITTDSALSDPAAYLVTLTPYSILPDWQELFHPERQDDEFVPLGYSRPRLSDMARLYSAFRDLYRMLDQIEKDYTKDKLARFGVFLESLPALSAYSSRTIDMFGGLKVVRDNKSSIRDHMSLMEEIFEYCFLTKACINRRGVENFDSQLNVAVRGLIMEKQGKNLSGDTSGNGRASVSVGNSGTAGREQVTSRNRESLRDSLNLWIHEFFKMLAEAPLPNVAFDPLRVAGEVVQEFESIVERKEVMRGLLNDMIYYERVEPWGRSFCDNGAGSVLCIDDVELGEIVDKARISIDDALVADSQPEQGRKKKEWSEYDPVYKECWKYYQQDRQCP